MLTVDKGKSGSAPSERGTGKAGISKKGFGEAERTEWRWRTPEPTFWEGLNSLSTCYNSPATLDEYLDAFRDEECQRLGSISDWRAVVEDLADALVVVATTPSQHQDPVPEHGFSQAAAKWFKDKYCLGANNFFPFALSKRSPATDIYRFRSVVRAAVEIAAAKRGLPFLQSALDENKGFVLKIRSTRSSAGNRFVFGIDQPGSGKSKKDYDGYFTRPWVVPGQAIKTND